MRACGLALQWRLGCASHPPAVLCCAYLLAVQCLAFTFQCLAFTFTCTEAASFCCLAGHVCSLAGYVCLTGHVCSLAGYVFLAGHVCKISPSSLQCYNTHSVSVQQCRVCVSVARLPWQTCAALQSCHQSQGLPLRLRSSSSSSSSTTCVFCRSWVCSENGEDMVGRPIPWLVTYLKVSQDAEQGVSHPFFSLAYFVLCDSTRWMWACVAARVLTTQWTGVMRP